MMVTQYQSGIEICRQVKEFNKNIKTVVGGYFPTFMFDYILRRSNDIDYIIVGEGERTFEELLDFLDYEDKKLSKIRGIAFLKNGKFSLINKV